MYWSRRGCAAAALAAMFACNGGGAGGTDTEADTDTDTGTTGEVIEFAEFFTLAEQAYCGWAARCGAFASQEDCEAAEFFEVIYPPGLLAAAVLDSGFSRQSVEYLLASQAAGRIVFDPEAAAACLAYVEARGCRQPETYEPEEAEVAGRAACSAVMRGTMVVNGPCLLTAECAPQDDADMVCGFDPTCADACCIGGCRALPIAAIGSPCNGQTRCAAGSFCASDPISGAFTVCTAKRSIGAACQNFDECEDGSYCDFNTGNCRAPAGEGEACAGGCQPGLLCADPGYVGDPRCYAYETIGNACPGEWWNDGCSEIGVGCSYLSNTCEALPGPGQGCAQSGEGQCAPTASCDWNTNTCVALAREGKACGDGIRCAGALQCDGWDIDVARCRAPEVTSVCAVPGEDELPQGT